MSDTIFGRVGDADRAGGLRPEPLRVSAKGAHPSRICSSCGGESRFEGRCAACIMADFEDDYDDECYECGGEGFVSSCFSEYACLHPEDGCAECTFRCDVCNPRPRDSDEQPKAEDPKGLSGEAMPARAEGIAQPSAPPSSGAHK